MPEFEMDRLVVAWKDAVFELYLAEEKIELDPAYSGNALDAPNEADESQELTCVDIDTFLENFSFTPDPGRHEAAAPQPWGRGVFCAH